MFEPIRKFMLFMLLLSLTGASLFGSLIKNQTMVIICFTVAFMDIIAMFICYKAYLAGKGQPRLLEDMPMNIQHKVEYHHSNGDYNVIGLRKCTIISREHMLIKISDEVISYLGKIPELPQSTVFKPEYVMLTEIGNNQVLGWSNMGSYKEHR